MWETWKGQETLLLGIEIGWCLCRGGQAPSLEWLHFDRRIKLRQLPYMGKFWLWRLSGRDNGNVLQAREWMLRSVTEEGLGGEEA